MKILRFLWLLLFLASPTGFPAESEPKDYSHVAGDYTAVEPKKDPKTGFVVGGTNATKLIRSLPSINGIPIAALEKSMRPEGLSRAGFLGKKESLLEVMAEDNDWVLGKGLTHQELARELNILFRVGLMASERFVESEPFLYRGVRLTSVVFQTDGYQESPFRDDTRASCDVVLKNLNNGKVLRYSPLVPLMVERYGFYEGHGTPFRVDPKDVLEVLPFLQEASKGAP